MKGREHIPGQIAGMLTEGNKAIFRMLLHPDNERSVAGDEFSEGYKHAIRTIYSALCLLDIEGREKIEPEQILGFKRGIEEYLTERSFRF